MEISRREFMKLLGFSTVGAGLGVLGADSLLSVPDRVFKRAAAGAGIETWMNSLCTLCTGGCGIRVRRIDGIPVRVTGNRLYPVNRGGICPRAEAAVEMLFHPHRLTQPLKRVGNRGDNDRWQPVSWEEALAEVAQRLSRLRSAGTPERLVVLTGDTNTAMSDLLRRFLNAYGSPNLLPIADGQVNSLAEAVAQGRDRPAVYDLLNTNFVLNFGGNFLDDGPSPVRFNQIYAHLRNRSSGGRTPIIHIDSNMSRTAIQSTEWVPINPGSMAALALGIAHVMIKDQSYDAQFVRRHTFGFEDWKDAKGVAHKGFRRLVDEEYYPERVASITGVAAKRVIDLARDFASAQPALAISGGQAVTSTNGLHTVWAIYCLNALKGNLEKTGGVLFPSVPRQIAPPPLRPDEIARTGLSRPSITEKLCALSAGHGSAHRLPDALLSPQPYAIDTLIVGSGDPVFESGRRGKFAEAFHEIPFIVSCSPFFNETTALADLILPDHVFMEKWDASWSTPAVEFQHFGVQQPVIAPLYDTRHTGDVVLQISQALGPAIAAALPWKDYKTYLQSLARGIFESGEGTIVTETAGVSWIDFLKKRGWQPFDYASFDEFWDVLLEKGGWWNPSYEPEDRRRLFATPSGKFEFFSRTLQTELEKFTSNAEGQDLLRGWKIDARGDVLFLPHLEPPRFTGEGVRFAYHLLGYKLLSGPATGGANLALLQELAGVHSRHYWHPWVEINPETARRHGIVNGDWVDIVSPKGSIQLRARVVPTVMPEVVAVPFGFGQRQPTFAGAVHVDNPLEILAADVDFLSGVPSLISTKVRIEKAKQVESRAHA